MVLWNMLFDVFTYFSQRVGVTATLPDKVPYYLPVTGPQEWYYGGTVLFHNGRQLCSDLPNLWDLNPHQSVGLLLTASGDLHVFLDGRHAKKVAHGLRECQLTHSGYNNYILTYTILRDNDIGYTLYNIFDVQKCN